MLPEIENQKRSFGYWLAGIILAVCCVVLALTICFSAIKAQIHTHISQTLSDVTHQYSIAVATELRAKSNLIQGTALRMPQETEEILRDLRLMDQMRELYQFKRVGYVTADGMAYSTDGIMADVTRDPFWETVAKGDRALSQVMDDPLGIEGELINVFTAPIFAEDGMTVRGYLYAAYPAGLLRELVSLDSFDGHGSSYIMLSNGDVVSSPQKLASGTNIFALLRTRGERNAEALRQMGEDFASGKSGLVTYYTDTENYMYYMPVTVMEGSTELYLATVVPAKVLNDRTEPLLENTRWLVASVMAAILIFLLFSMFYSMANHRKLMKLAYMDPMTEHDNYTAFRTKMRQRKAPGYIISVDIAEFKIINNVCGVRRGDRLIREMWEVLAGMLKKDELGCHISGDQYVLFLTETDLDEVINRVNACCDALCALSVKLNTPEIVPKFGIYPTDSSTAPEQGYGKANLAKKSIPIPRDRCYAVYDEEIQQHMLQEKWMEDAFDHAVANNEFEVWYQPKYDPKTGMAVGAEALSRWRRPNGELYTPGAYVPLFERNGMIARLDEYMFRRVCANQKNWLDAGLQPLPVSVNVSRTSLYFPNVLDRYLEIIRSLHLDQRLVMLEITESAMIDNTGAEEMIRCFRDAGFLIEIDDFGQGYSSLATLNMKCFTAVKLDKSLVDCVGDLHGESLLYYVINLAHGLGLAVTAEGVEQQAQVDLLKELRCDEIQGYYYCRPLPQWDFSRLLKRRIPE